MIFYDDGEFWRPTRVGDGDSDERGGADGTSQVPQLTYTRGSGNLTRWTLSMVY